MYIFIQFKLIKQVKLIKRLIDGYVMFTWIIFTHTTSISYKVDFKLYGFWGKCLRVFQRLWDEGTQLDSHCLLPLHPDQHLCSMLMKSL